MGVAGSYLAVRLSSMHHEVTGFERFTEESFDCVCAWGTSAPALAPYAAKCGLDFQKYVFHRGRSMYVKFGKVSTEVPLVGLVTFDKHRMVKDMQRGIDIRFGVMVRSKEELKGYDLIVDATAYRTLLPRITGEIRVPSVQYEVEYAEVPFDDFYIEIVEGMGGYLWYFPLTGKRAHVGAGDVNHTHLAVLSRFMKRNPGKKKKIVGRPIRLSSPSMCEPFFQGNVVGVGECIGSVFPLLGEGIIPTMQCAELLARNITDLESYRRQVLKRYQIYDVAYDYVAANIRGRFVFPDYLLKMNELGQYVIRNERRFGYRASSVETLLKSRISL